jgi:hypothetical protein
LALFLLRCWSVILRFTLDVAALIGESPAEWETLEGQARAGRWTTAPLVEVERLRALASDLGVPLQEEGLVPGRRRRQFFGRRKRRPRAKGQ